MTQHGFVNQQFEQRLLKITHIKYYFGETDTKVQNHQKPLDTIMTYIPCTIHLIFWRKHEHLIFGHTAHIIVDSNLTVLNIYAKLNIIGRGLISLVWYIHWRTQPIVPHSCKNP